MFEDHDRSCFVKTHPLKSRIIPGLLNLRLFTPATRLPDMANVINLSKHKSCECTVDYDSFEEKKEKN